MPKVTLTFWKEQSVLATILQTVAAVLLLVAFIFCCATLGVFTKEFNDSKDDVDGDVDACFLYVDSEGPGANSYCEFIIAAQSIILIALVVLMVLLLIGVFIRFGFPVEVLILLLVSTGTFLLSFVAAIVLSAGFDKTCKTIDDASNGRVKCSDLDNNGATIYSTLQQSTGFSWIETIFVGAVVAVASVYFVMRVRKRSSDDSK